MEERTALVPDGVAEVLGNLSVDVQVLEIMQRLVEELQEVRFLDPPHLVIFGRLGDLDGELVVPCHCHLDFRIPVNGSG